MAAILEPGLTVLMFLLACAAFGETIDPPELMLCLFVFALTFPGRDRFRDKLINAAVDILGSWLWLLALLLLLGVATRSLNKFNADVLLIWGLATPASKCCALVERTQPK